MQVQLKPWGNSQGIRFSKEFLKSAGFSPNETLTAEVSNGTIVCVPLSSIVLSGSAPKPMAAN